MTPYEHYVEAEKILAQMEEVGQMTGEMYLAYTSHAQVHATLATCHMTAGAWTPGPER